MTAQKKIDQEAAFWAERMSRPLLDVADGAAFDRWMESSPRHREAFAEMAAIWDEALPAMAALDPADRLPPTMSDEPDSAEPTASGRTFVQAVFSRRRAALAVAVAACVSVCAVWVPPMLPQDYASTAGHTQMIALADGSRVELGGNSALRVQILPWRRNAVLTRGEAEFDVAHEANRPFEVTAGAAKVRVLGTAFYLESLGGAAVGVQVSRGLVEVSSGPNAIRLAAGEAARVEPRGIARVPLEEEDHSWQSGWFVAQDVPLADVIEKLRRYSRKPILLANPTLGNQRVVGRFQVSKPELVFEALEISYGLNISISSNQVYISKQK